MLDQHCPLCHGWKSGGDDYCGGNYCLKKERKRNSKVVDAVINLNDEFLEEGYGNEHND